MHADEWFCFTMTARFSAGNLSQKNRSSSADLSPLSSNMKNKQNAQDVSNSNSIDRRKFLATSAATAAVVAMAGKSARADAAFSGAMLPTSKELLPGGADSLYLGHQWESLNPGYWQIKDAALRRRIENYGDRARRTGFPFHGQTHGFDYQTEYDPSLPLGIAYRPQWFLEGRYEVEAEFTFEAPRGEPKPADEKEWNMYQDGHGVMGVALGGQNLFESFHSIRNAIVVGWTDARQLEIILPPEKPGYVRQHIKLPKQNSVGSDSFELKPGDQCKLSIVVTPQGDKEAQIEATLTANGETTTLTHVLDRKHTTGYLGVAGRGLIDFSVDQLRVKSTDSKPRNVGVSDCYSCYPLGDTLTLEDGQWKVKFIGLFASGGNVAQLRVADSESPAGGWENVPVAGSGVIIDNQWRRNTAVLNVELPENPGERTLYYTVWKDGQNVTADNRVGTDACGRFTGLVGDVPGGGNYVGRLPQLTAPYKVCGLSCHAISRGLQQRTEDGWKMDQRGWAIRDQPTVEAYKHLNDYNFQVMLWEDDVWYMELELYPPSTDDAYKIVTQSICGPTSRWQMMRHWNVINPGDHDFGMDDVKGPEQIAMRNVEGLGQDRDYMRRNFQIVHHLVTGAEEVDPTANLETWRSWKMPQQDFTLVVCDSRSWRSSQEVDIWDDAGWEKFKSLYDRTDPTRSLLGEAQFAWLQELLATDTSPVICMTGISGMHTVWGGDKRTRSGNHPKCFDQRDRVVADYAGWVKAGADRVLELMGSRDGVVSVYGDVHNGCLMKNEDQRVIECSFGPIGRSGGRIVVPGFGPEMQDIDGRNLEVVGLYHKDYGDPKLTPRPDGEPYYWNFLEMEFDSRPVISRIGMRIRNLVDAPSESPRGGGSIKTDVSLTGRPLKSKLPDFKTLPSADVRFMTIEGHPVRGARSDNQGVPRLKGLVDVQPGTKILVTAFDGKATDSRVLTTIAI